MAERERDGKGRERESQSRSGRKRRCCLRTLEEWNQFNEPFVLRVSRPLGQDERVVRLTGGMGLLRVEHDDRLERPVEVRQILDDDVGAEPLVPVLKSSGVAEEAVRHVDGPGVELLSDGGGILKVG
jgi:hypothetical protein